MKIKSGKHLTQLEIIKRLNLMGINYDPSIIGKNYYINLYDKEIQSPINQQKIQKELEKDRIYQEFLNNNLRRTKQSSIQYLSIKNNTSNINKKYIFDDFNIRLYDRALFCYNTFDFLTQNKKFGKEILNSLKSFNIFNKNIICSEIKSVFKSLLNFVDKINLDIYHYLFIIIFICSGIMLLFFFIKYRKRKNHIKIENHLLY